MRNTWLLALALLIATSTAYAQIEKWQLGGSGQAWDQRDSLLVLIDFEGAPGAIQPLYLQPDPHVIQL